MHLPVELLENICANLPLSHLPAVAASSSLLCAVAQRLLYKHVALGPGKLAVAVTLARKPHLARHVRTFSIVVDATSHVLPAYYRAVTAALAHMQELVSLSITVPPHLSSILPLHASFPRLKLFQASFGLDDHLACFLNNTPQLRSLTLDQGCHLALPEVPPTAVPHLSSFTGSSQAATQVIPGRPVTSIFLTSGDLTEHVVAALARSSAAVSTLDATTTSLPLPILEALALAMPQLENIRLTTTYNLWDEFFNTPFIQNIKNALMAMDHLKSANVSGMLWKWLTKDGRVLTNEPHVPPPIPDNSSDESGWVYDSHNAYHHH